MRTGGAAVAAARAARGGSTTCRSVYARVYGQPGTLISLGVSCTDAFSLYLMASFSSGERTRWPLAKPRPMNSKSPST